MPYQSDFSRVDEVVRFRGVDRAYYRDSGPTLVFLRTNLRIYRLREMGFGMGGGPGEGWGGLFAHKSSGHPYMVGGASCPSSDPQHKTSRFDQFARNRAIKQLGNQI